MSNMNNEETKAMKSSVDLKKGQKNNEDTTAESPVDLEQGQKYQPSADWRTTLSHEEEDIHKRTLDFHKLIPSKSKRRLDLIFPWAPWVLLNPAALYFLSGVLKDCEDAMYQAEVAEQRRQGQRTSKTKKNASMYMWYRVIPQDVPYFCILLSTIVLPLIVIFSGTDWAYQIGWYCIWGLFLWCASGVEVRHGTLKTTFVATLATTGAALLTWVLPPDSSLHHAPGSPFLVFSFFGLSWMILLAHLVWAMYGIAFADICINLDILSMVKPTSFGRPVCIVSALVMNFLIFVPMPVAPAFWFGFSLVLPCTAHLKSSMILGRPDPVYCMVQEVGCCVYFLIAVATMIVCMCMVCLQVEMKAQDSA